MKAEAENYFNELFDSFDRFKVSVIKAKEDYEIDLVLQRFDFITERFLRFLKMLLESKGYNCILPEDCIKAAARFGFLAAETVFLEMLDDKYKIQQIKNQTYSTNQKIPDELYQRIKIRYTIAIGKSLERIQRDYFSS